VIYIIWYLNTSKLACKCQIAIIIIEKIHQKKVTDRVLNIEITFHDAVWPKISFNPKIAISNSKFEYFGTLKFIKIAI